MLKIKLLVLLIFAAGTAALLLTDNAANPRARAYSTGPPAGYTHAPGELDCSDCHTTPAQSTGTLTLNAPQHYTPGQTYDIKVTHASTDPTRVRWGFELTALDGSDQKAGTLAPADDLTQVVNEQGPFPAREYVEHTSKGTFPGQQNGASWTFKWTAPTEDSSGDNIYFTFAAASFQPPAPDFQLTVTPTARTLVQGSGATYDVTVTPLNGFTGTVALDATGLPANATASFQPASLVINDSSPRTATLNVNTSPDTPKGSSTLNVNATSGALSHSTQAALNVVAPRDVDLAISQTVSPNPAQVNSDIKYTINVTNNGPATPFSQIQLYVTPRPRPRRAFYAQLRVPLRSPRARTGQDDRLHRPHGDLRPPQHDDPRRDPRQRRPLPLEQSDHLRAPHRAAGHRAFDDRL